MAINHKTRSYHFIISSHKLFSSFFALTFSHYLYIIRSFLILAFWRSWRVTTHLYAIPWLLCNNVKAFILSLRAALANGKFKEDPAHPGPPLASCLANRPNYKNQRRRRTCLTCCASGVHWASTSNVTTCAATTVAVAKHATATCAGTMEWVATNTGTSV